VEGGLSEKVKCEKQKVKAIEVKGIGCMAKEN
jgi:hypothetical protein